MSAKEAYRKEMEVGLEVAQVKINMFKQLTSCMTLADVSGYVRIIAAAESQVLEMRTRLREFDWVQENVWQQLRIGVEQVWSILQMSLHNIATGLMANKRSAKDPEGLAETRRETRK